MINLHGLVGAHRVGKSTLAETLACTLRGEYVPIDISVMQHSIGYSSAKQDYPWHTRKHIQECLLELFDHKLVDVHKRVFTQQVTRDILNIFSDRTPLDLIGYAMWSFPKEPTEADHEWMQEYTEECINLTNKFYDVVALVQPGIPLVESPTSAPADPDMIETFNQCYLSLMLDPRITVKKIIIPRECTDLIERGKLVLGLHS